MPSKRPRLLVTAGPTVEPIDPVRFLSNRSSGKMGYALAETAVANGCEVTLVSGPTCLAPPDGCRFIPVKTARDMRLAVLKAFPKTDVVIKAAAVADYRPVRPARHKIKKTADEFVIKLTRNPDILKELGMKKRPGQVLVGFAAETRSLLRHALEKMAAKNLDWIVANDVLKKGVGFESEENAATLIARDGARIKFPRQSKVKLAAALLKIILASLRG